VEINKVNGKIWYKDYDSYSLKTLASIGVAMILFLPVIGALKISQIHHHRAHPKYKKSK